MVRADFVTSLVLILVGFGVVAESWRMPRYTEFGSSIWSAPGIVPGMIGVALAMMGAALLFRAQRARAAAGGESEAGIDRGVWLRVGTAFVLCFLFAAVLVGLVPFLVASFVFILTFVLVFDLRENPDALRSGRRLMARGALAVAVAFVAAFAIARIFQDVFFVRLP